ncbi:TetR/AcrR family transcriptional regulator [Paenibacillus sanguinis]|uniref:TetR/AcrR family transcriptional regulator n=1 Tax=Paenibacillus sanguinis TaxID=225906 RepID=UPI0003607751|nr:TetR/AcrR family transcriptional regulator [Paenibacillus sanguinis]
MQPKLRLEQERITTRELRRRSIIQAAQKVFWEKGFENSTMQDIAHECSLGIATVFRYFSKKEKLIVAVASEIVCAQKEVFADIVYSEGSCYEKLGRLFDALNFYEDDLHQRHSKLIEAFEGYIAMVGSPVEDIEHFQTVYAQMQELLSELGKLGVRDGTIRSDIDIVDTLLTMMNTFGHFSQKMAMIHDTTELQTFVDDSKQFIILKNVFMEYLKPKHKP